MHAQVLGAQPEHVERVEDRLAPAAEQFVELWLADRVEADEFTIEDCRVVELGQLPAQARKAPVHFAAAGNQFAPVAVDVRQSAEAVVRASGILKLSRTKWT